LKYGPYNGQYEINYDIYKGNGFDHYPIDKSPPAGSKVNRPRHIGDSPRYLGDYGDDGPPGTKPIYPKNKSIN
jgi:hypothetical protein